MRGAFGNLIKNNQKVYSEIPNLNLLNLLISNKLIGCFSCVNKDFLKKYLINLPIANVYHDHWVAVLASIYSQIYFIDIDLINIEDTIKTTL